MKFTPLLHSLLALAIFSFSSCREESSSTSAKTEASSSVVVEEESAPANTEETAPQAPASQVESETPIMIGDVSPRQMSEPAAPATQAETEAPIMIGGSSPSQAGQSQTLLPQTQNYGPITMGEAFQAQAQAEAAQELTPEQQKQVLEQVFQMRAKQQAEGLGSGKVKVNKAWIYRGYSEISPDPNAAIEARLVAVDVTIGGHTPYFDIDDIEIVDDATLVSYGSDPFIAPLRLDGTLMSVGDVIPQAPAASRWLLIYAYPKDSPRFQLYYWGQALLPEGMGFESSGLALPYPSSEE